MCKGPSVKDVRIQGRGGCPVRTRGFFICGRLHFLMQKNFDFLKFMVCPHGQGGVEPVRTFFGQEGRGSIFHDSVRTSFMDDP